MFEGWLSSGSYGELGRRLVEDCVKVDEIVVGFVEENWKLHVDYSWKVGLDNIPELDVVLVLWELLSVLLELWFVLME